MLVSDLNYDLPYELIAQHPLDERDASRMMIVDRHSGSICNSQFVEFPARLRENDVIVINNTRVFPARLYGRRMPSGAAVEIFLIRQQSKDVWETLARPARRLRVGSHISFEDDRLSAEVTEAFADGRRTVRFSCNEPLEDTLEELGQTPLPPYIKRENEPSDADRERYQTIYARHRGAIAAPTAGLHFTQSVMNDLAARNVEIIEITLHVGYGTFQSIRVEHLDDHEVAPERFELTVEAARQLNDAREARRRVIAIGTTTTRALESSMNNEGRFVPGSRMAELTIKPGYRFRAVDALLTNFHLPGSSLLALVVAFAGLEQVMSAYRHAVESRYRFYSYGDCMLII
jgi:S-adenosylmethionine:tRNA ribosyltransferase-isomerase